MSGSNELLMFLLNHFPESALQTPTDPVALEADAVTAGISSAFDLAGVSIRAEHGRVTACLPGAGDIPSQQIIIEQNFSKNL